MPAAPFNLIATSAFGLEAVVVRELSDLGYGAKVARPGRIAFSGDATALCRANMWLRSADRVLVEVASFTAADFDALFDTTRELPWEEWIAADAAIPVGGRSIKSQLSSVPAIQRSVKKAIVERLLAARPGVELPETGPPVAAEVSLVNDLATIDLDTSGHGLHRRGYRTLAAAAQLRETLAAAMVQLSFWKPDRPLVDPFCGTGTIIIEAAMIGRRLAPGRNRQFAAEGWNQIPAAAWQAAREEAADLALPALQLRPIGCDADPESLKLARYHAGLAGVADDVHFQQHTFDELTSSRQYGCVITNPPYGVRMGEEAEIEELYRSMPDVLRRLKTWSHFILTAHPDFERLVGQEADKRRKLYNGRLQCNLYQFFGPKPPRRKDVAAKAVGAEGMGSGEGVGDLLPLESANSGDSRQWQEVPDPVERPTRTVAERSATSITPPLSPPPQGEGDQSNQLESDQAQPSSRPAEEVPVAISAPSPSPSLPARPRPAFGGLRAEADRQAAEFGNRLKKLARHLRRWPTKRGITCYRIYERDIPEAPLVVDRYEDALHIAEFDRPHDRTAAEHADWLDHMVRTAAEALETPMELTFLKHRQRQRGKEQYERFDDRSALKIVNEAGLKFEVNLSDYLDTGLFLDHRVTRGMVRDAAAGKRMLNLFAYTGSFSVYAAAGGAIETVTVDLSPVYLEWAERNFELNGLRGLQHQFVRADSREFVASLNGRPQFDLAVVDPPTFSNSKRVEDDWDVQQDHQWLLNEVLRCMNPGGVIYFSTNSRKFKFDEPALNGATVREISKQTVPEDFRNKRIHRCWRIVKTN
ncbi:bifunctional 23S rRNA (guanine(2069)-N(7))-methyltransferase RlmK/23S rRNA (guanine(2445)-N(2))-methyltransferase RlmL [Lacipirellula limnantheis]|uniref:Ribosomal RNA large subunit methyltransferase K n=1 Tax=Lacipirellula limnantheis TaxID=2528024 RepID=A0A517TWW0_9BACT|nr:bifunctional 23S rRNA (guanine(2069)-N(7))-methyltransferase RlmK/23S rRNA (guanine(2445)-N(2))-methyltransferase RlmL [Lacipirellula limnantheis]QDT72865.1 Ribosomal RNA large subunit methyltransferase K [Lacipirellula limnantheis]